MEEKYRVSHSYLKFRELEQCPGFKTVTTGYRNVFKVEALPQSHYYKTTLIIDKSKIKTQLIF